MNPWELKGSDEAILPYWLKLKPDDFYFAIKREGNATIVCIAPGAYYEVSGQMYIDSMPINGILPHYLIEILDGIYETNNSLSKVFEDLLEIGFIHNKEFQSYIEIAK